VRSRPLIPAADGPRRISEPVEVPAVRLRAVSNAHCGSERRDVAPSSEEIDEDDRPDRKGSGREHPVAQASRL
jgi:hypothetical protein